MSQVESRKESGVQILDIKSLGFS